MRGVLVLVLVVIISSCSSKKEKQDHKPVVDEKVVSTSFYRDYNAIKESGKLTVVIDNSLTSYFLYKGEPKGYEYELLDHVTTKLGLELELKFANSIDHAIEMVNTGEADLMAWGLTITKSRKGRVLFTEPIIDVQQVLVQRKPDNWRDVPVHVTEKKMLRKQYDLADKEVYVVAGSAFKTRLESLSNEIGEKISVVEAPDSVVVEDLIEMVEEKVIDYTVADNDLALMYQDYNSNVDVSTPISFDQRIAWAVHLGNDTLKKEIDRGIKELKNSPLLNIIHKRYYKRNHMMKSRLVEFGEGKSIHTISKYDDLIKEDLKDVGWDWRIVSALIYHESEFDPNRKSWVGAMGLMQLMPATGKAYGAKNLYDPKQNIKAGTAYLKWLNDYWKPSIDNDTVRVCFILASYNAGQGHVQDAIRLTKKYGGDPYKWEGNVAKYLALKAKPKYYKDSVVKHGYCRGQEPVQYVSKIFETYKHYKELVEE